MKSHPAAGHSAEHPESPELVPVLVTTFFDQHIGESIGRPRNDRLQRSFEVSGGDFTDSLDVALRRWPQRLRPESASPRPRPGPLSLAAQQIVFGHHFQNRSDVLCHAAVNEHQAVLDLLTCFLRRFVVRPARDEPASIVRG